MKHLIIGSSGEIGQALLRILKNEFEKVYGHDLDIEHDPKIKIDIIHICFPYNKDFPDYVFEYVERFGVKNVYVVIHSTVLPFTTTNLSKIIKNVIYSPVRGTHPNLYEDMLKWKKYLASDSPEGLYFVEKIFQVAGFKTQVVNDSVSLEFAKHYDLLMFALGLVATQEIYEAKHSFGIDPSIIREFVNDGYYNIYPYTEAIGGHCVIPNMKVFQSYSQLAYQIIRMNEKFSEEYTKKGYKL